MSTIALLNEIKTLPHAELQRFLAQFFSDEELVGEMERWGYLKLTEKAFEFWNDPREDIYQDYARVKLE
jgi:hypothetical protein